MGIKETLIELLKGILPEQLINIEKVVIDNRKIDNRKIEIKNSSITYDGHVIEDKALVDEFFKRVEKYQKQETLPFQVIHEGLLEDYGEYEEISIQDRESLKKFKNILSTNQIECILMARRVFLAFNKQDEELGKELLKQLETKFPQDGKKVFNLISTGYFDELVIPFIDIIKAEQGEVGYVEAYKSFYDGLLKFFPIAVFVGNNTTEDKLKHELLKRLALKDVPFVKIHTIGDTNIKKVERVTSSMKFDNAVIKDNRFITLLGIKAQIYEIRFR
jgi:hypothetical protein